MNKEQVKELFFEAFLTAHQYFSEQDDVEQPEPPIEPVKPVVNVDDYASPELAVAYAETIEGGARVVFPSGDFAVNLDINAPNIEIYSEHNTILRPETSSCVVDVLEGGTDFVLDGFDVRGQTLAQELVSNDGGNTVNTKALHCIRIQSTGARLRNYSARGARIDSLYLKYRGMIDFESDNFILGSSARNPCTLVAGQGVKFTNGRVRIDNTYTYRYSGLYLFDCEPNFDTDQYRDITFINVDFENAGSKDGNRQVILQDTRLSDDINDVGAVFDNCRMLNTGGDQWAPYIRLLSKKDINKWSNIAVTGGEYNNRVVMGSGEMQVVTDSTFKDIELGDVPAFSWNVSLSDGTVVDGVTNRDASAVGHVVIDTNSDAKINNVLGYGE